MVLWSPLAPGIYNSYLCSMKPTITIITVLLLALLASCGGGEADRRMDLADSLMEENPDSAYAILQAIDSAEISGDSRRARHALLTTQARVKTYRNSISDTAALPLLDYYTDHGSDFDRMRAAFYKAEIYAMTNNYTHQIRNLIEAEEIAAKLDDIYWLAKIFEGKSLVYNNTGYHQESINCDRAAINL